jgi:hypothetical protein
MVDARRLTSEDSTFAASLPMTATLLAVLLNGTSDGLLSHNFRQLRGIDSAQLYDQHP